MYFVIGIIGKELVAFPIIERIKMKYNQCNIYLYSKEATLEEKIKRLREKQCRIIIIAEQNTEEINEYSSDITVYRLKEKSEDDYELQDDILEEAIKKGNQEEVIHQLKTIKIPKNKTIYLKNPILLWIKEFIQKEYPNPLKDSIEILLEEIEKEILQKNYSMEEKGIIEFIK